MGIKFYNTKSFRITVSIFLLFAFPFIGNRLGRIYGEYLYEGRNVKWNNLGKPPGEVNSLLACREHDLWIYTEDGEIYRKEIEWQSIDLGDWKISIAPEFDNRFIEYEITNLCHPRFYKGMKYPPLDSIECCHTEALVPDGIGEKYYALLSDGNVWIWQHRTHGGPGGFGIINVYYLRICCGTLIGLVCGILSFRYLRKKNPV